MKLIIVDDAEQQKFIPRMIEWYQAGTFPFDESIKTFPIDQFDEAEHA